MSIANWTALTELNQIEFIRDASEEQLQLIFKHSTTCPLSSIAKHRLDEIDFEALGIAPFYLDLLAYRPISNEIASSFGVQHESPQIIIVYRGEASYDESHLDIDQAGILEHLQFLNSNG